MENSNRNLFSKPVRREELNRFARAISTEWKKATESILAVAKHCADANEKLTPNEKKELLSRLPFGSSVFSKLSAIGNDARLAKASIVKLLPPNYSTIYEISHLSDSKFREALKADVIQPTASRTEIIQFAKGYTKSTKEKKPTRNFEQSFLQKYGYLPIQIDKRFWL